uniref:NADH-ubiquinone oxidoreductase chain 2 n=1 Tax=Gordius sp. VVA-2019 TaxID=2586752 RepID=A0A514ABV6_9BILA|nr:NADH dehydrogenase subunit 2 [Gordius sp. VVA-2019]
MWCYTFVWCISSVSFVFLWQGLALNLVTFLLVCLLSKKGGWQFFVYFVVQSTASLLFLILSQTSYAVVPLLLSSVFMMKAGVVPLHNWFVSSSKKGGWQFFVQLSTLQKLIPLWLCISLYKELPASFFWSWDKPVMLVVITGLVFGLFSALQTLSIFMLMVYSSLSYSSWLICSCLVSADLYFLFMVVYCLILWAVYFLITAEGGTIKNRMASFFTYGSIKVTAFFLAMLFLAGFPPTPLFFLKIYIMKYFVVSQWWVVGFVLMAFSVVSYFYYMRVLLSWFLLTPLKDYKS